MTNVVTFHLLDPKNQTPLQQWSFTNELLIRVGRSPDNDIVLDEPVVSRYHLELQKTAQAEQRNAWYLVNRGTNGTFVNGTLMSQGFISDGSLIQLARGGPTLRVNLNPSAAANPSPNPPAIVSVGVATPVCSHTGNPPGHLFCMHCGQPIRVERIIREYQVLRVLGQGGMGTTYLAWYPGAAQMQRPQIVVIKEMNADVSAIPKAQELFEREARVMQSLNHPGIPKFFDFFVDNGKKYLVMEMIHGQDLEKRVLVSGPATPQQAIAWMLQTCEVLDYIHSQDPPIVHRDIKPANLMLRQVDNRIVLLDFGAVKEIGTPLGTRIGSLDYSAPEQNRGQPLTQSDLYAIGPTLIFLLSGESPQGFYQKQGSGYRYNLERSPTITPELAKVIERVTEPKPSDRYQTAKELALALQACL